MENIETHNNLKEISRLQTQMENVNEKIDDLKEEQVKIQQEQKQGFEAILGKIDGLGKIYVRKDNYRRDFDMLLEKSKSQDRKIKSINNLVWLIVSTVLVFLVENLLRLLMK